jgi:hypothetical protein
MRLDSGIAPLYLRKVRDSEGIDDRYFGIEPAFFDGAIADRSGFAIENSLSPAASRAADQARINGPCCRILSGHWRYRTGVRFGIAISERLIFRLKIWQTTTAAEFSRWSFQAQCRGI